MKNQVVEEERERLLVFSLGVFLIMFQSEKIRKEPRMENFSITFLYFTVTPSMEMCTTTLYSFLWKLIS